VAAGLWLFVRRLVVSSDSTSLACHPPPPRLPLSGACSSRVVFSSSRRHSWAFVALLDGSAAAVRMSQQPGTGAAAAGSAADGEAELQLVWRNAGHAAPVFSSPVLLASQPQHGAGGGGSSGGSGNEDDQQLLVVGHVDGLVRGLQAVDGSEAWRVQLQGQLFADLVAAADSGVLAATHASQLYCLAARDGSQLWCVDLGAGPLSAAPLLLHGPRIRLVVCCSSGALIVLSSRGQDGILGQTTPTLESCMQLPSELFSSPVAAAPHINRIVFGCRDDHVYCLQV
jgi:hypothetical protein